MIKLNNVTKYYKTKKGRNYILKNVTYEFPDNKSIGLFGRNGTGKSTLLRLLGGIELPNSGSIERNKTISWPVALNSAFLPSLNAEQNIRFVCQLYNKSDSERRIITNYVREFAEIGNAFDEPVKSYSTGMKSRLNFGLSMAFDFDYYLVDESISVGDSFFKKKPKQNLTKNEIMLISF